MPRGSARRPGTDRRGRGANRGAHPAPPAARAAAPPSRPPPRTDRRDSVRLAEAVVCRGEGGTEGNEGETMDAESARRDLTGCYTTIPTLFRDDAELSVDLDAMRRHVRFLIDGGLTTGNAVLLAGGAAGDFSTLTFDERLAVAEGVIDEAAGRVPIAMGGQTTSTQELQRLVRAAERLGAAYVQVSPPFYFDTTEDDFYEHVVAGADAGAVGLILYNTFWTSLGMSSKMVERVAEIKHVVGLKWATPDTGFMAFEQVVTRFKDRFSIIDNQMRYVISHMLGARSIEIHQGNYWPQFAAG